MFLMECNYSQSIPDTIPRLYNVRKKEYGIGTHVCCYVFIRCRGYMYAQIQGLAVVTILAHPRSTGRITLQSTDPTVQPKIDPKYYSDEEDYRLHIAG